MKVFDQHWIYKQADSKLAVVVCVVHIIRLRPPERGRRASGHVATHIALCPHLLDPIIPNIRPAAYSVPHKNQHSNVPYTCLFDLHSKHKAESHHSAGYTKEGFTNAMFSFGSLPTTQHPIYLKTQG